MSTISCTCFARASTIWSASALSLSSRGSATAVAAAAGAAAVGGGVVPCACSAVADAMPAVESLTTRERVARTNARRRVEYTADSQGWSADRGQRSPGPLII